MTKPELWRPEQFAEREIAKEKRTKVLQCGGCRLCIHRDKSTDGWNISVCTDPSRTFPACVDDTWTPAFELDLKEIK